MGFIAKSEEERDKMREKRPGKIVIWKTPLFSNIKITLYLFYYPKY